MRPVRRAAAQWPPRYPGRLRSRWHYVRQTAPTALLTNVCLAYRRRVRGVKPGARPHGRRTDRGRPRPHLWRERGSLGEGLRLAFLTVSSDDPTPPSETAPRDPEEPEAR